MSLIIPANSLAGGGYQIDNSLRCEATSNDYLNRTVGTPTDEDVWTFSTWFKVTAKVPVAYRILGAGNYPSQYEEIYLSSGQKIEWYNDGGASNRGYILSSGVLRDSSAWYHLVCIRNGATVEMWLNGINVGVLNTAFNNSYNTINKSGQALRVAQGERATSGRGWDGYISETHFIDGQALTPTDFGEFDEDSGVWKPIAYSGTYGTNGFFLEFQDSGALGTDSSGNTNTFTVNNLTSVDQSTDTPTNNFATLNPLAIMSTVSSIQTLSEGNLKAVSSGNWRFAYGSIPMSLGKWYVEVKISSSGGSNYVTIGLNPDNFSNGADTAHSHSTTGVWYNSNGEKWVADSNSAYGDSYTTNDIIGVAINMTDSQVTFYKNGVAQNSGTPINFNANLTGASSIIFGLDCYTATTEVNFGSPMYSANGYADGNGFGDFSYAVPTGYYALNTRNLNFQG